MSNVDLQKMEVVLINHISIDAHNILKKKLLKDYYKGKSSTLHFGKRHANSTVFTNFIQWIIVLSRKFKLLPTRHTIILPVYNQRQIIQLSLAQLSKKNSNTFEAYPSEILDLWKFLYRANVEEEDAESNWLEAFSFKEIKESMMDYNSFLTSFASLDHFSLMKMLKEEMRKEDGALTKLLQDILIIVEDFEDFTSLEFEFMKILFAKARITRFSVSTCQPDKESALNKSMSEMDEGIIDEVSPHDAKTCLSIRVEEEKTNILSLFVLDEKYGIKSLSSPNSNHSVHYIEQLFMSHVRLLLNTRDELAIAFLLSMPGRELDLEDFNAIRKVSAEKNMPIYQMIMSTIFKLKLGGKGYQPDMSCPIVQHKSTLSQFVDSMMKLQNIIEDQTDGRAGAAKVLSLIKLSLTNLHSNALPKKYIDFVYSELVSFLDHNICLFNEELERNYSPERKKSFSKQTIAICRKLKPSLQHLLLLCDLDAGRHMSFPISDTVADRIITRATPSSATKLSHTPFKAPSILSLFKSPEVPFSNDYSKEGICHRGQLPKENDPKDSFEDKRNIRAQSFCAWAGDISPLVKNNDPAISPIFGPTLKVLGGTKKPKKHWREILADFTTDELNDEKIEEKIPKEECVPKKKSRKRLLLSDVSNIEAIPTEAKKTKKEKSCTKKKKALHLSKGQPQITNFFRTN